MTNLDVSNVLHWAVYEYVHWAMEQNVSGGWAIDQAISWPLNRVLYMAIYTAVNEIEELPAHPAVFQNEYLDLSHPGVEALLGFGALMTNEARYEEVYRAVAEVLEETAKGALAKHQALYRAVSWIVGGAVYWAESGAVRRAVDGDVILNPHHPKLMLYLGGVA